ncbi:MAG: sigma-70 family RNA polymerase sigma factor [Chromatiaceae bacterium]|nr:MAG: sigma-70 family RNA polymerase sigma factor [Chromatiaceae bacterium]
MTTQPSQSAQIQLQHPAAAVTGRYIGAQTGARPRPKAEQANFTALVEDHSKDLFRYAYRLCGNHHTAQDLVQDSLLRAWRSFGQLQDPAASRGWLKTIVRRENARRFERIQPQETELSDLTLVAPGKDYDTSTEAFVLRQALQDLAPEYREPLLLQVLHGCSQQEIAERLGLTSAGVGTRLFRARQKLRGALGELG